MSWTDLAARHRGTPVTEPIPPDVAEQLRRGKLEQTCPRCGRTESAGGFCSRCSRRMGPGDWYPNGNIAERTHRKPVTTPANPPIEYRRTYRPEYNDGWPPAWGPNPYSAPRSRRSPVSGGKEPAAVSLPTPTLWPA